LRKGSTFLEKTPKGVIYPYLFRSFSKVSLDSSHHSFLRRDGNRVWGTLITLKNFLLSPHFLREKNLQREDDKILPPPKEKKSKRV
jgi:hypothetical protein